MTDPLTDAPARPLGERVFSAADQAWFGRVSLDLNPMHVDEVAARRLLSGRQVVHGIHTLIQALDLWQPPPGRRAQALSCSFDHPVSVGDRVQFEQTDTDPGRSVVRARVNGLVCTEIGIAHDHAGLAGPGHAPAPARPAPGQAGARHLGGLLRPLDEPAASWPGQPLWLPAQADAPALAARYGAAAQALSPAALAALADLSYVVGMVCPGLHSVFSSLQVRLGAPAGAAGLQLQVKRHDPRFRLFTLAFDGALAGELRAFQRPAPQAQPGALALKDRVRPGEFQGLRSLVVGGSRGLGELCAKLLAVGGAEVLISYAQGQADAQAVVDDIALAGAGACRALALDLLAQPFESLPFDVDSLHSVLYFATPRIYTKRAGLFDAQAFELFSRFYLQRFHALCLWLEGRRAGPKVKVYLPSTVFITERPKGMTEYAMAKAAAELLAADINRQLRQVEVVFTRLPRLATDQTSAILEAAGSANVDVLLPLLRALHGVPA